MIDIVKWFVGIRQQLYTNFGGEKDSCIRNTTVGDTVDCYRNLNKPNQFSIKQRSGELKGKVSGYSRSLILRNPQFIISEASRRRVLKEGRNVHAFVRGEFLYANDGDIDISKIYSNFVRVSYSPYVMGSFYTLDRDTDGKLIPDSVKAFWGVNDFEFAIINGADVLLSNL